MPATNESLVNLLLKKKLSITTVESCTGGAMASAITDIPGASEIFRQGFVVYANAAKIALAGTCGGTLGHEMSQTLQKYTVYSHEVADMLALVGMQYSGASIGIGITGTLSREDPHNPGSTIGHVYVTVMMHNKWSRLSERNLPKMQKLFVIPPLVQKGGRAKAKAYVVNGVCDLVEELIELEDLAEQDQLT